jgi:hypothetical protein
VACNAVASQPSLLHCGNASGPTVATVSSHDVTRDTASVSGAMRMSLEHCPLSAASRCDLVSAVLLVVYCRLSPVCIIILEKPFVAQLVKKFLANLRFIIVLTVSSVS